MKNKNRIRNELKTRAPRGNASLWKNRKNKNDVARAKHAPTGRCIYLRYNIIMKYGQNVKIHVFFPVFYKNNIQYVFFFFDEINETIVKLFFGSVNT